MRIVRSVRKNIYQHRSLDISFTGDTIALVGENGSGKSNFLISLGECLTGEYQFTKDRVVSRGAESGYMEDTILLPDNRQIVVKRSFPSGNSSLHETGREPLTATKKVNARILELLGVEKPILQNIVFVGQKEIDNILFADDSIKDRLAQKFFGLEKANQIERILGDEVNSIRFDSADQNLESLLKRRKETSEKLLLVNTSLAGLGKPPEPEEISLLETQMREAIELRNKITAHKALAEAATILETQIAAEEAQYGVDKAGLDAIDPKQIDTLYQQHLTWQAENASINLAEMALAANQKVLADLGEAPHKQEDIDALEVKIAELTTKNNELCQSMAQTRGLLDAMGTSPICPTCNQAVDISGRVPLEEKLKQLNLDLQANRDEREPMIGQRNTKMRELSAWNTKFQTANGALTQAKASRAKFGELHPGADPNRFLAMRQQYDALAQALANRGVQLTQLRYQLQTNRSQQEAFGTKIRKEDGTYLDVPDATSLETQLQAKRSLFTSHAQFTREKTVLDTQLAEMAGQITIASKAAEENRVATRYQRELSSMRAVFHPDGGPRILVGRNTKRMEARINHYLAELETPFSIVAKEGLSFDCVFPDGVAYDRELSVGQKTDLAWAFRFAACETFSSSVGLMTLDEPTAPLDKKTKACFNQVVESLKDLSKKYGMQFFISTHDDHLTAHCDQVVRFESPSVETAA